MSTLSLFDCLALVVTDTILVGHPVAAWREEEVGKLERELVSLWEEHAESRRQPRWHNGNSGQLFSQKGPVAPPRTHRRRSRVRKAAGPPVGGSRAGGSSVALLHADAALPAQCQVHVLPKQSHLEVTGHRAHAECNGPRLAPLEVAGLPKGLHCRWQRSRPAAQGFQKVGFVAYSERLKCAL